jgi:hypothetical protein
VVIPPTIAIGAMDRLQQIPYFLYENNNNEEPKVEAIDVMNVS